MFGFDNWIKKKEAQWIHEVSDPFIPKIEKALIEFDSDWFNKLSKISNLDVETEENLSYFVDLTKTLTYVFKGFLSFVLYEKNVHEDAFPNMEKAWIMALTKVCKDNEKIVNNIHSNITAFVLWDSKRLELTSVHP